MAYNKQQWRDEIPDLTKPIKDASGKQKTDPQTGRPLYELVQEGTRITSARLNHIEDGIETVNELADQNTADIDTHKKDAVKHITAAERAEWKAKETPAGAQTKADAALSSAKTYADTALLAKADKSSTYSKTETDQRIQAVVGAAPDALDTLKEIGDALNNDPNFAATVTNQLSGKVDKVAGKQLSTEDYSSAEKAKLAGLTPGAGAAGSATDATIGNRTADPSIATPYSLTGTITQWFSWIAKYFKAITGKANPFDVPDITLADTKTHVDNTTVHVTAAERTAWNAAESNAKNASIPKTEKGSASGVPAMDAAKLILGNGIRLGATPFYGQQAFLLTLAAVSNQKADIIISGPVHGRIKVTIAGAYAGTDAKGVLVKTYAVILSPPNVVNSAPSRYLEATDDLPNHISIGEIAYDATNARYFIPIEARSAYINTLSITVETWSSVRDATVSLSPVYTGAATTLPKAVQVLENNVQLLNGKEFQKHQLTQNDGLAFVYSTGSLDTLTTPGDFYTGGVVTGKHADFGSGLVEVRRIVGGNVGVFQRATDFSSLRSFIRYLSAAGTWLSWYEFEHSGRRNVANGYAGLDPGGDVYDAQIPPNIARKGVVIADGTDLNSIAEGEYYCFGNVNAATMTNMPAAVAGQAFSLSVTKHAGYNQRLTTYIAGVTMRVFTRNIYNGVFSEWYELEHSGKKNAANGYAGLDSSAKVPRANTYNSLSGAATLITNMDTLLSAGTYPVSNTATGAPETGYGQVLVIISSGETHNDTNWIWQVWFGVTGITWVRQKINNGIWQPWAKLWTGKNDTELLVARAQIANNTDYNTITTNGIYPIYQPTGTTNAPPIVYGILTVSKGGGGVTYVQQVVMEVTTGTTYTRMGNASTWTPWVTNITSAGGNFTGAVSRTYGGSSVKYNNVASYYYGGANNTGTLKITLPVSWNNAMMNIKITGFDYSTRGSWELSLGCYNFSTGWSMLSASVVSYSGTSLPFSSIRFAHDGGKCCILLGNTTTIWQYPSIEITEVLASHNGATGLGGDWTMSVITSEVGISGAISTPITWGNADSVGGYSAAQVTQGTLAYAVTTGTAPTLVATFNPAVAALSAGLRVTIKAHAATTGPVTLNVNGLGAKSIKKPNGNNPPLALGGVYTVVYDGTAFILQGEGGEYGTATAAEVLAGKTIGTENGLVTGTIPNRTRTAAGGYTTAVSAKGDWFGSMVMEPPTGYYESGLNDGQFGTLLAVDPNFVPSSILSTRSIFGVQGSVPVITAGDDPAQGVGKWGDGSLAVYPREGYRKGGPGAGEIKVTTAQLRSVEGDLAPANIRSGVEVFGVTGTLIERMYAEGYTGAHYSNGVYQISGLSFKPRIVRFTFFKENSQSTFVYLGTDTERWNFVEYAGTNPYGTVISSGEMPSPSSWGNGFSAYLNFSGISVNILWNAWR